MKKRQAARRLLSLLLAAQLLCVQLPMAFASSLEETEAPAEDTVLWEGLDEAGVEQSAAKPLLYYYRLGYGVDCAGSSRLAIASFDDYFGVERTGEEAYGGRSYTSVQPDGSGGVPYVAEGGQPYTFCVFPDEETLGRVPDREFSGWYVYPKGTKVNEKDEEGNVVAIQDPKDWVYGDAAVSEQPIQVYDYQEGDLGYDLWSWYGDTRDMQDKTRPDYQAYGYGLNESGRVDSENPVDIVGRWVASGVACAADKDGAALTAYDQSGDAAPAPMLYDAPVDGKPLDEAQEVVFTPERTEYWLRVGADVTTLNLVFNAFEPYYDYNGKHMGSSPVTVTNTFGGDSTDYTGSLAAQMLPLPDKDENTGYHLPNNKPEDPAHSQWTVEGISLRASAGTGKLYNDVKVAVTSPDGKSTTTYTFHVQRLAEPSLTRSPGNTPVGMIARDTSVVWGTTEAERAKNKRDAVAYFTQNHRFGSTFYPQDAEHNQSGSIFRGSYSTLAWLQGESNVDLDASAIVVYQDTAFLDPGIALTDAEGNAVTLGSGVYSGTVTRTLKLRTAGDRLTINGVNDQAGAECWYSGGALESHTVSEVLTHGQGTDQINLRGLKVLPGIYSIEYAYTDPASGATYDATGAGFTDPEWEQNKDAFHRTLVVLPTPGDVDMDGAVTSADAAALKRALNLTGSVATKFNGADLETDHTAALFGYRVCDLNHNGALEQSDLDSLEAGFSSVLNKRGDSDYYYLPLPTDGSESRYTRAALQSVDPGAEVAKLNMVYMGKEKGVSQPDGSTLNPQGPDWTASSAEGVTLNDTFWLGVKLSDAAKSAILNQKINTFTFTLTYDSRYVKPAVVLSQSDMGLAGNDHLSRWKGTMRVYNLGRSSQTVWGSSFAYYLTAATGDSKEYTTHYSKAVTPLESGAEAKSDLKELVFSIQLENNMLPSTLGQDGYLLTVPFTLVRHPYGQSAAQLVELGAGMREFVFVSPQSDVAVAELFNQQSQPAPVAAYSTQAEIFGGATGNLRDCVGYLAAGVAIPLGEDKTETTTLYNEEPGCPAGTNAVYSTKFTTSQNGVLPVTKPLVGALPDGLTYDGYKISGTPTKAGDYSFSIGGNPYRIIVEKAPLHFWANNPASYYGQPEFRGSRSEDFTYSYDKNDIRSIDRDRAANSGGAILLDGKGANLGALLGTDGAYTSPAFTAKTKSGTAVTAATDVGVYAIDCELLPMSRNYSFVYTPETAGGAKGLTLKQRPFAVTKLAAGTKVGEIYSDTIGVLTGLAAVLKGDGAKQGFVIELPKVPGEDAGLYKGYPLTAYGETAADLFMNGVLLPDDELGITYTGTYQRLEKDLQGGERVFFVLDMNQVREDRDVAVSEIALTGENSSNYTLVQSTPTAPLVHDEVTGSVTRRNIKDIRISRLPSLKYRYGDQLNNSNALNFFISKGNGSGAVIEGEYAYNLEECTKMGVSVTWATEAERVAKEPGSIPYEQGQTFTVKDFHGLYLCVSAPSQDDTGKDVTIVRYSEEKLEVTPLAVTLTAKPVERYYGEPNGELTFTYNVNQLAYCDRQTSGLKGEGAELAQILKNQDYTAPTLKAVVSTADRTTPVTEATPYTGSKNAVVISDARCANYVFNYTRSDSTAPSAGWGDSTLMISKRPIVVKEIDAGKAENLATIYADTKRIYTDNLPLSLSEVVVALPQHTDKTTTYFPLYGTADSKPVTVPMGYTNGTAVLDADSGRLALTYTATVVPTDGAPYIYYTDFAKGYYNMSDVKDNGVKKYPVQVSKLALSGTAAGNYVLVYEDIGASVQSLPGKVSVRDNCVDPEKNNSKTYYVAGSGSVKLRPIESITILSTPRMTYTYGEAFMPTLRDPATKQRLAVSLNYATEGDNYAGNTTSEKVEYSIYRYDANGQPISTFDDRSLSICWLAPGQETVEDTKTLTYGQYLTVEPHNGARLAVAGRRGENDVLVKSKPTTATLAVVPLTLTLTADDQSRSYGEPNGSLPFTFRTEELAAPDLAALGELGETGTGETLALLAQKRGFVYTAPTGSTTAEQGSPVLNGGSGSYPIELSGGSLSNYKLKCVEGALHIYPRLVKIDSFISSYPANPLYTIYSDTKQRQFDTNVDNSRFTMALSTGDYPMTGSAIYGGDTVTLKIKVEYFQLQADKPLNGQSGISHNVNVAAASIVPGTAAASNYKLEQTGGGATIMHRDAVGAVELRRIDAITVKAPPTKLAYTYGEALDLSGLVVAVDYVVIGDVEKPVQEDVVYQGADQFAQYGLFVNYWGNDPLPDPSGYAGIKDSCRKAETGDHLTVAPTHDSQLPGAAFPGFTPNGRRLIISAQRHEAQNPAVPQIVDTPITVAPLALKFNLAAGDKTYDRDAKAVGTLTLQNVFREEGVVDQYNQNGVTDMVYPVTGADYESTWKTMADGYENFKQYIADKLYSFTTGTYRPAGPAPLGENYPLSYTPGYKRETGLSFTFLDPNVAYETAPTHDSYGALTTIDVQATGIALAGPDAANYTIIGEVTPENVASAMGYQGNGLLPKATVHKANRPKLTTGLLPQAEIDIHTNVLRLTYPQVLSAIEKGEAALFESELHFEYALQYDATVEGTPAVGQFAGMDGKAAWWDERFFGGEAYLLEIPEGYVPSEQDIPKDEDIKEDTILKGQLYRWATGEDIDPRFVIDSDAYPGGAQYPGYDIYKTDRSPLPRNTVLIPVVRAAETHNYNASPILSATTDYTPELAQAVADTGAAVAAAEEALLDAETDDELDEAQAALAAARSAAADAARAALSSLDVISTKAKTAAQGDVAFMQAVGESGKWPEKGVWPEREIAPAVKSYAQRIDLVSTENKQNDGVGERQEFTIPTLEAVWFTDLLEYPESKYFDVMARNNEPTRYYGYAWDSALSAQLKFDDKEHPFSLAEPIEVEIKRQGEDGKEITETVTVNKDHTAVVYVNLSSGGGFISEKSVQIEPRSLYAAVGDAPRKLEATVKPSYATYKTVTWTTSDSAVATVDKNGVVTFVGPGTATITATTRSKKTDSITVTVVASWKDVYPKAIFNVGYLDAFFRLEDDRFNPEGGMTRGEAVELLAQFYVPNASWKHTGTGEFTDLTGDESYAAAAKLLGSLGVITGAPDGSFAGERPITRAEFVVILTRMLGIDVPDTKGQAHAFLDSGEKDTWAYSYIDAMDAMGILNGVGGSYFAPGRAITRVEAATFLTRILRDGVDTVTLRTTSPSDVREDYWGYAAILRAVNGSELKKP